MTTTQPIILVGPLADSRLIEVLGLTGTAMFISGRLTGGQGAGVQPGDWPVLRDSATRMPAVQAAMTPRLRRYADVMGLVSLRRPEGPVLASAATARAGDDMPWVPADWPGDLAAAVARDILALPADRDAAQIAARLPMMAVWADLPARGSGAAVGRRYRCGSRCGCGAGSGGPATLCPVFRGRGMGSDASVA